MARSLAGPVRLVGLTLLLGLSGCGRSAPSTPPRGGDVPLATGVSVPAPERSHAAEQNPSALAGTPEPSPPASLTAEAPGTPTPEPRVSTPRPRSAARASRAAPQKTPRSVRAVAAPHAASSIGLTPRARRTAAVRRTGVRSAVSTAGIAAASASSLGMDTATPAVSGVPAASAAPTRLPAAPGGGSPAPPATTRRASSRSVRTPTVLALPDGAQAPTGGSCPPDAPIKGSRAHVYHTPASRTYETLKPVICFTTPAAAQAAGYRDAKN